jgi:hypothetical protein
MPIQPRKLPRTLAAYVFDGAARYRAHILHISDRLFVLEVATLELAAGDTTQLVLDAQDGSLLMLDVRVSESKADRYLLEPLDEVAASRALRKLLNRRELFRVPASRTGVEQDPPLPYSCSEGEGWGRLLDLNEQGLGLWVPASEPRLDMDELVRVELLVGLDILTLDARVVNDRQGRSGTRYGLYFEFDELERAAESRAVLRTMVMERQRAQLRHRAG